MLVDTSKEEVVVLKLHGSIDWFDRTDYTRFEAKFAGQGLKPGSATNLVFQEPSRFRLSPLLDGTRFPDDPLREMYRARDIERLYKSKPLFFATPSLLNPSSMKILFSQIFREFWRGFGYVGTMNFRMAIIGFSLPPQDDYAKQAIYRLVRNYQNVSWDETWDDAGHKKSPLVLVDYRASLRDQEDFRSRYAFVDWQKAVTCFTGFNENALCLLSR